MLRIPTARVLDETDEPAVTRLLATDPVGACVLAGRVEALRPGAVERLDALFRPRRAPWCPEEF